jgi:hypothetical protein
VRDAVAATRLTPSPRERSEWGEGGVGGARWRRAAGEGDQTDESGRLRGHGRPAGRPYQSVLETELGEDGRVIRGQLALALLAIDMRRGARLQKRFGGVDMVDP